MKTILSAIIILLFLTVNLYAGDLIVNGNLGVGSGTTPTRAKLELTGAIGSTSAIFGADRQGISLISSWPGVGYNMYWNTLAKSLSSGYAGVTWVDPTYGDFQIWLTNSATGANQTLITKMPFIIKNNGNVGIGTSSPTEQLDVSGRVKAQDVCTATGNCLASVVPAGALLSFAGSTAPSGWLLCDGRAVSRTSYAALFAAIGTIYGAGDGATTFNVPDMRGRIAVGLDNMGGSSANRLTPLWADSIGGTGGEETHALSINEMPAHTHPLNPPVTVMPYGGGTIWWNNGPYGNTYVSSTGSTGGSPTAAHNNVQPSIAINYIIKF